MPPLQIYLTKWMARFIRQEKIASASLLEAIQRAERGLIDADLGGGLIKQRVARAGKGRSGGYRTLIAYRRGARAVFIFGFAKSGRENIAVDELKTVREVAATLLAFTAKELQHACEEGEVEEVGYGD